MFTKLKTMLRTTFPTYAKIWEGPQGLTYGMPNILGPINPYTPMQTSPFWAALRLHQNHVSSLPLITYQEDEQGGRTKAKESKFYTLLHDRPNPSMSRPAFWQLMIKNYFIHGECFANIRWAGNGTCVGLYPIQPERVVNITLDSDWNKTYHVNTYDGSEVYDESEMIHVMHNSEFGIRGQSFLMWASQALNLHGQVQEAATAFYRNSINPSGFFTSETRVDPETQANIAKFNARQYAGASNTGMFPYIPAGITFNKVDGMLAKDAAIIEALGASVADIARWFDDLDPLMLGDRQSATYSNLGAANQAFYQRNLLPILDKLESEMNHKLFTQSSSLHCSFQVDRILRGDPLQAAQVNQIGIMAGYKLRSEVRAENGDIPILGLDEPIHNLTMGPTDALRSVGDDLSGTASNNPTQEDKAPDVIPPNTGGEGSGNV